MASLRDAILGAADLPVEVVETPEWAPFGVPEVRVRGLTAAERDAYEQSLVDRDPKTGRIQMRRNLPNVRASFVVRVIVDENGERVFTDADAEALGKRSGAVIDRLWDKARALSGMATEEELNPTEPSSSESP